MALKLVYWTCAETFALVFSPLVENLMTLPEAGAFDPGIPLFRDRGFRPRCSLFPLKTLPVARVFGPGFSLPRDRGLWPRCFPISVENIARDFL
jgi:hypothetical protein